MDPKEWKERSVGMPLDPAKQEDPEEEGERLPGDGGREALTDLSDQNGGQRSEVGVPYNGAGDVQRGQRDAYNEKSDKKKR
ncbi:hypothetical protein [Hyalangium rubrum]|uniref:Uncharacterized protein n=1 Tax=Hyalangium rubrum TaxID=3103134 RepID=A0ABU5H1W6_9BACT|nr:hypothetical protein [Hyalangium sp. s54d21]MDY7227438.1 hypothetical protein [Hyalangium sp. s54d21]